MHLLFLDTETNSLSPSTGQIIEIAGIIAELDPLTLQITILSHFQSLVALTTPFEDKITRLTGILPTDLEQAPLLNIVQEMWRNWLDKFEAVSVIGHSINFDLSFLSSEKWYLPGKPQVIDTLYAAKILYPTLSAVNLEYIFSNQELEPNWKKLFPRSPTDQLHRALYDTEICLTFYQESLLELNRTTYFPSPFFEHILEILVPHTVILFNSYTGQEPLQGEIVSNNRTWTGNTYFDYNAVCTSITATQLPNQAFEHLAIFLPSLTALSPEYKVILLASVHGISYKYRHPKTRIYLHIYGQKLYSFSTLLLTELTPLQSFDSKLDLDNLIPYFAQTQTTQLQFRTLLGLLTLLNEFEQVSSEELDEFERLFDFWYLYASKLAYEGSINPYTDDPRVRGFFEKFTEILAVAETLHTYLSHLIVKNPLSPSIIQSLQKELTYLINFAWKNGILETINLTEDDIRMVNIQENPAFLEIINNYEPNLQLTTYTSLETATCLLTILGMNQWTTNLVCLSTSNEYTTQVVENLTEQLNTLKAARTLVLISQNKILTKTQYQLTTTWEADAYLVYGESGSVTKIQSKILLGYNVPVFIRLKDWNKFSSNKILSHFTRIVVIGLPYVHVPRSVLQKWGEKWRENLDFMRSFQLQGLAGQVHTHHIESVEYWNV